MYLYQARGQDAVNLEANYEGDYEHLHCTAIGKTMMAYLPEEQIESIVDQFELPTQTENLITDRQQLFNELEEVRSRGYAIDDEESIPGGQVYRRSDKDQRKRGYRRDLPVRPR